ncbi:MULTISPECIES: oligosaccharide flippase family protein [unclassified Ruegeria]|uniref:oligosaccharide flippase family protein n=1 Tax=unclassified Ruegeria TaxID=2625375 RepID=UPI00148968C3|nr:MULTISPECIES: oligosaccharide flippase family protein [unclassified Ruegeria]
MPPSDQPTSWLGKFFSRSGPKFLRDLLSLAGGQALSMVVGFITFAYLARQLSPEDYGTIELAISIAAFAAIVIECGVGPIGVKALAVKPADAGVLASQIPVARFIMALFVIPAAFLLSLLANLTPTGQTLLWIYITSLIFAPLKQEWLFQGLEHMNLAALARPIRSLGFAAGVFLLVHPGTSIATVGWIECVTLLLVSVYYIAGQYYLGLPFRTGWPIRESLTFLKTGAAVGLSNMLWAFMLYAPMMLLSVLAEPEQSAWLGAAQRLVISLLVLSFIYHFNLYPAITRSLYNDLAGWERMMQSSIHVIAWGGIFVALSLTLFATPIMTLVFGEAFATAAPVLICLSWVFPLRLLSGHARWSLIAKSKQRLLLRAEIVGALALITVALICIPHLGAVGAALSFFAAVFASACVTQFAVNRQIGAMSLIRPSVIPGLAALAALTVWFALGTGVQAGFAGLVVFVLCGLVRRKSLFSDLVRVAYAKPPERASD